MKSGLYAWAGASATASAAAWAKRFEEPITNRSKVYFGFTPPPSWPVPTRRGGSRVAGDSGASRSMTVRPTRRSWPVTSRTAAPIRPRKWLSIHSRVKSFGTARTKASSESSTPTASANQVWYVVSFSAPLSRPETSVQRFSAVSSIERSTLAYPLLSASGRREHSSASTGRQWVETGDEKAWFCRYFQHSHMTIHTCGRTVSGRHISSRFQQLRLWTTLCPKLIYTGAPTRPSLGTFPPLRPREADLPAKRAQAQ